MLSHSRCGPLITEYRSTQFSLVDSGVWELRCSPDPQFDQKLELCADSLWDFDRILYFQCHEEGNKLDLKAEVSRARRELEKANAKGGGPR